MLKTLRELFEHPLMAGAFGMLLGAATVFAVAKGTDKALCRRQVTTGIQLILPLYFDLETLSRHFTVQIEKACE